MQQAQKYKKRQHVSKTPARAASARECAKCFGEELGSARGWIHSANNTNVLICRLPRCQAARMWLFCFVCLFVSNQMRACIASASQHPATILKSENLSPDSKIRRSWSLGQELQRCSWSHSYPAFSFTAASSRLASGKKGQECTMHSACRIRGTRRGEATQAGRQACGQHPRRGRGQVAATAAPAQHLHPKAPAPCPLPPLHFPAPPLLLSACPSSLPHLLLRGQQLAHAACEIEFEPVLELDEALQLILGLQHAGGKQEGEAGRKDGRCREAARSRQAHTARERAKAAQAPAQVAEGAAAAVTAPAEAPSCCYGPAESSPLPLPHRPPLHRSRHPSAPCALPPPQWLPGLLLLPRQWLPLPRRWQRWTARHCGTGRCR
jgi:hypothetical protein